MLIKHAHLSFYTQLSAVSEHFPQKHGGGLGESGLVADATDKALCGNPHTQLKLFQRVMVSIKLGGDHAYHSAFLRRRVE